ncbi:MAG TPA: glycosyltransferase family 1 protein [Actinomycetota bacterium]|nr:glycosyltransferase family 1 protein [Actinomycetota bacterium]
MKAVVAGMIGCFPVGGVAWDYGQYALGLERLGFDVYYLEDCGLETYDPRTGLYSDDPSYGVDFLGASLEALSPALGRRWHFRAADDSTYGMPAEEMAEAVATADVFVNVSGGCLLRDEYLACRRKVLIDTDPGWNHFVIFPRLDARAAAGGRGFREHDFFFTYAERIGRPGCELPELGIAWHPTRPPVVSGCWAPEPPGQKWTTVMSWDNYRKPVEHGGRSYGSKGPEFERIERLPELVDVELELATGGVRPPVDRWRSLGWTLVDSQEVSLTPDVYRSYVQSSRGEFSVAKNIYAATGSGWFSCRSACYLAAGRPVVLQDTGFSESIPAGKGVLAFRTLDEAVRAIEAVEADYDAHSDAAREVALQHLDSDVVLSDMLERLGLG